MSPIVNYVIMIIAFIAMLWANQQFKSKGVPWGRPAAGLFGIIAVFFALFALWNSVTGTERITNTIIARENKYTQISYKKLGDHLGAYYQDKTLLIIKQNFGESAEREALVMDALKEGLQNRMEIKVVMLGEEMDPNNPDAAMMGPEYMLTPEEFEKVLYENVPGYQMKADPEKDDLLDPMTPGNPRNTVVLSMMGLPMDMDNMPLWNKKEEERPVIALVNANLFGMKQRISDGYVSLVMTHNPTAVYDPDAEIPDSENEAFDSRFILITDLNVNDKATTYPSLFGE